MCFISPENTTFAQRAGVRASRNCRVVRDDGLQCSACPYLHDSDAIEMSVEGGECGWHGVVWPLELTCSVGIEMRPAVRDEALGVVANA